MIDNFQEGFEYFRKNTSGFMGATDGAEFGLDRATYVASVNMEISEFEKAINDFGGTKTSSKMLKGDIAEFWHAYTFNVDAARNRSGTRMFVDRSHEFGSVDVIGSDGQAFGMKYYANGTESAKAQAVSIFQRFKEYQSKGGKDDLTKYLTDRNYNDIDAILNDPIYSGQIRVIPCDQLKEAIGWLERMIKTEELRRPEQVKRYQDTLQLLRDKISDNEGNESIPLSKDDAEKLATLAKEGKFDASEFGITAPEVLNFELLMRESMKAGVSAAVISLVLKVGPEIYKAIDYLIKNGELEEDQFKKIGFAAVSGSSEGFIRGSVAAAITSCCKSGFLGVVLKDVNPSVVGAVTVLAMNAVKGAYGVATGKKTRTEMADEIIKDMFVSTCALVGGGISQVYIEIPVIGYLIGSFVGSIVGSFAYSAGYSTAISFCVDSGFTMFGIVEQDYRLPEDIIEEIGIDTFDYESFIPETFNPDTFEFASFSADSIEPESIGIKCLRRGVIEVTKIGYVD